MKKIILILTTAFILSGCNRLDEHQPLTSGITKFSEGESISLPISPSRNNLNTVSICLRNPQRELIPLTFSLSEGDSPLRTIDFSSGNIDHEDCTKFKFEPIPDSQGKKYLVTVSSQPPSPDKLIPTVLTVEKYQGAIHYKTFYYQPLNEVINESISGFIARLNDDLVFTLFWSLFMLLLIIKLIKSPK